MYREPYILYIYLRGTINKLKHILAGSISPNLAQVHSVFLQLLPVSFDLQQIRICQNNRLSS